MLGELLAPDPPPPPCNPLLRPPGRPEDPQLWHLRVVGSRLFGGSSEVWGTAIEEGESQFPGQGLSLGSSSFGVHPERRRKSGVRPQPASGTLS